MTTENLAILLSALGSDPSLKARMVAATSIEEAIAIAQASGIAVEASDLLVARNLQMPQLSDAELEAVAGGASDKWIGSCGTCASDKMGQCCAVHPDEGWT